MLKMKFILRFLIFLFIMQISLVNTLSAQWIQTNGPFGGTITCFAVSGNNLFTGTEGAGVNLSSNNGMTWTPVYRILISLHLQL